MSVISFEVDDLDQIQAMVSRPFGGIEAWDLEFCQTECGSFAGSYAGTTLASDRFASITENGEQPGRAAASAEAAVERSVIWVARHRYNRRLHANGRSPGQFFSLLLPANMNAPLHENGQVVGPDQLVSFSACEEVDFHTPSQTDFLSLMIDSDYAQGIFRALGTDDGKLPGGVLTPDTRSLRSLKEILLRCLEELANPAGRPRAHAMKALETDIEEALISVLASGVEARESAIPRGHRPLARLARDFLEDNVDRQVTIAELCAVTGARRRTLMTAFKSQFGASPISYHKYRRLEFAREDLRRSHAAGSSVTEVAMRYGFWHLGRFSVDYRRRFGEAPSQTRDGRGTQLFVPATFAG